MQPEQRLHIQVCKFNLRHIQKGVRLMSKRIWGVLALAAVMACAGSAYAHDDNDRDRAQRGRYNVVQIAQENGYRDGVEHGRYDRQRRIGYNYKSNEWKRGERGYQGSFGSKGQYKQSYRDGYQRGYDDGFNGRGGWGNNGSIWGRDGRGSRDGDWRNGDRRDDDWRNGGSYGSEGARIAYQNGLTEGRYYAQQDQARGRRENAADQKGYKDADRGYSSRYDREEYKRAFREAFVRGYNEVFNTYGRRW
jgi:hypothetical protein